MGGGNVDGYMIADLKNQPKNKKVEMGISKQGC